MKKPLVSAILLTYNRSAMARRAIASVLNQTWQDFELLVLDNSSTDDTEHMVASFQSPRIRYIKHAPCFVAEARNIGVREARGEYIGFLDDDDEWCPRKLEQQVAVFRGAPAACGLVYGGYVILTPEGRIETECIPEHRGWVFERILATRNAMTGAASVPLIKRECFDAVGLYEPSFRTSEDDELYLRVAEKYTFDFVPEVTVKIYRHRGYHLGGRIADQLHPAQYLYDRYRDCLERYPATRSSYLQTIGGLHCRLGRAREGRRWLREAVRVRPTNWRAWAQLLLSFCGQTLYVRGHRLYKTTLRGWYAIPKYHDPTSTA